MRVKPCARCPYTPQDLTGHYDPDAALHVCAKCDGEQAMLTNHYPRETRRRRKCSTDLNIFGMTQRSGKFGLIRYYSWRTALCSKQCANRFKARREADRRWLRWLQAA